MRKILVLNAIIAFLFILNGCATTYIIKPEPVILQSEKLGIAQASFRSESKEEWLKKDLRKLFFQFEVIIHSEPEGVEVWKSIELLGKTPLAIPILYGLKTEFVPAAWRRLCYERFYPSSFNFSCSSALGKKEGCYYKISVERCKFANIVLKKEGYFDYVIDENVYVSPSGKVMPIETVAQQINGKSIEIKCVMIPSPENFGKEIKKLIEQKKFKEAEELKEQRITKLKQLIEREGVRDEYIVELKRLKDMVNLTSPEMAKPKEDMASEITKLKEDLDKAIKAGDYDKAGKIKELIEYKEKNKPDESLIGISEEAIKHN